MSLTAKWPAFDYVHRNGYYYLRIRSDQFVRVKMEKEGQKAGQDIAIIPTDDDRLKILTIPLDNFTEEELKDESLSLAQKVQRILKLCKI